MPPDLKSRKSERGQAVLLVVVAMGIVLLGALGFAIDGSQLFAQRRMAQAAADAAAEAGIISMLNGADGSAAANYYAQLNGFGGGSDRVVISSDASSMTVTVQRPVPTTLMKFLGASTSTISASATAAIQTSHPAAPQIIVTATGAGTFSVASGAKLTILGGANRVIQINSNDPSAVSATSGTVDLSRAGLNSNGADFAVWRSAAIAPLNSITGTGRYVQPGSRIIPADVTPPSAPPSSPPTSIPAGDPRCPSFGPSASCTLYSPGMYTSDINIANLANPTPVAVFNPGIYYLRGANFNLGSGGNVVMASDPSGIGILFYANSFQLSGDSSLSLRGSIITGTFAVLSGNVSISFPSDSPVPAYNIKQVALVN